MNNNKIALKLFQTFCETFFEKVKYAESSLLHQNLNSNAYNLRFRLMRNGYLIKISKDFNQITLLKFMHGDEFLQWPKKIQTCETPQWVLNKIKNPIKKD